MGQKKISNLHIVTDIKSVTKITGMAETKSNIIPSECPMSADYKPKAPPAECPMSANHTPPPSPPPPASPPTECPMSAGASSTSELPPLDPTNMMPPANQQPSPGQPFELDTDRQESSIPRGGTDNNWVYPSQQMFWNAMLRKGWRWEKDAMSQDDMKHIIRIHNKNNEDAWNEVLYWEAFRGSNLNEIKLMKFGGKATEYSPRARFRAALGYGLPFDRHDWIVDRAGRNVRYIIDYYDAGDENGYKTGEFVELDCRPALDSIDAAFYRSKAALLRWTAQAINWWRTPKEGNTV